MALAFGMFAYERSVNRSVDSELLKLDTQSWLMTALISAALLVAFGFAWMIEGTRLDYLAPYVDPGILALLSLGLYRHAGADRPAAIQRDPDDHPLTSITVRETMEEVVERHGFAGFTSYVAKVGRGSFIEIHIVVPPRLRDRYGGHPRCGARGDRHGARRAVARALADHRLHCRRTVDMS
jgi:predicted Co/Zn/Cd cation transporter (cation efflux family)